MSKEITHNSAEAKTNGDLSKESNKDCHDQNEYIKVYISEIEDLKSNLKKTEKENDDFKYNIIKNTEEFKQNLKNFFHNHKEHFSSDSKEPDVNIYFDSDNFPINNFLDIFNENYISIFIKQTEDKSTELLKHQKQSTELTEQNTNLLEELTNLKNENDGINKKFILIKDKYEESLKRKTDLEKENSDFSQSKEILEKSIEDLYKQNQVLYKQTEEGLQKIKTLEEQLQQKDEKQNDQELEKLKNLIEEGNKKLHLEKTKNAELEEKIKDEGSLINSLDNEIKGLKSQLENSKKLKDQENTEHENLIKVKEHLEQEAYKNSSLISELKEKIIFFKNEIESNKIVNENKGKDDLEKILSEKTNSESQLTKISSDNINLIKNIEEFNKKIIELNQDNENYKLENSKLLIEIKEITSKISSLDELSKESKDFNNKIKELTETVDLNKQLTNKLESALLEKENLIIEMKKGISESNSLVISTEAGNKNTYETENNNLKKEIDKLKEENLNLILTIQEKNEIIINLQNKEKELENACNHEIEITEEETSRKLLEMDLQIHDLKDKLVQNQESSREDEKVILLNSKYVDLKEKCFDFVGILQSELKDFEFYVDKRLYNNFLFKYFDKNTNEKLKYSLLETLANLLSLDNEDRKKLNLTLPNTQFASNINNNFMTDIESIPFIISKFNEYLENILFE
jgi:chromosome segregation ATPase